MSRFLKISLGLVVVVFCGVAGVYGTRMLITDDEGNGQSDGERQTTRVGVMSPEARSINDTVTAVGTLMPVRSVQIVPNAAGRVRAVNVESGQKVSQDDVLIQLDDRAAQAAFADAEATLTEARQEYRRYQQLEDTNAAAESRLEEARGVFRRAEAAMMQAEADLEDRTVRAPFAGTLGVIDLEPGAFLTMQDPVTRLSDLTVIEATVTLPERYFEQVEIGQTLEVSTPTYPDKTFEGQVTLRAPEIALGTRSFEIRAQIDNHQDQLVGGMFANSRLILGSHEGLAIPDDAIISEGLATYVYVVSENAAVRTDVEVGQSLGSMTEVIDGLTEDDRVVVAGWDQLTDGAPVQIDEDFTGEGLE